MPVILHCQAMLLTKKTKILSVGKKSKKEIKTKEILYGPSPENAQVCWKKQKHQGQPATQHHLKYHS